MPSIGTSTPDRGYHRAFTLASELVVEAGDTADLRRQVEQRLGVHSSPAAAAAVRDVFECRSPRAGH